MIEIQEKRLIELTKEELINECLTLMGERNKRLKADIEVTNANKLLESDNVRIKSIQAFIGEALTLDSEEDIYELTLETLIESFECENALYLRRLENNLYEIVYDFSELMNVKTIELKNLEEYLLILTDDKDIFTLEYLNNCNLMFGFTNDFELNDMFIVYNTKENIGTFEPLVENHLSNFKIILTQIGTLIKNIRALKELENLSKSLEEKVKIRTHSLKLAKEDIEEIHKHTEESIEYASLIQSALIPNSDLFKKYFKNHLTIWQPKAVVGGDIYLFEELRNEDECLLMVIDCTGHGVPGAFVTMLVKAIERQIIAKINNDEKIDVSPAWILSYFNKTMKKLLQQESDESISNAGFDGGIIYYNKNKNIIKFAGAETPLFYIENGILKTIKGDRQSIGYKKSDENYEFTDHTIETYEGMQFYITTDGYIDQNGGEKSFPFGKKRFTKLLEDNNSLPFVDQKELFLDKLAEYKGDEEKNDDVTIVAFKL